MNLCPQLCHRQNPCLPVMKKITNTLFFGQILLHILYCTNSTISFKFYLAVKHFTTPPRPVFCQWGSGGHETNTFYVRNLVLVHNNKRDHEHHYIIIISRRLNDGKQILPEMVCLCFVSNINSFFFLD